MENEEEYEGVTLRVETVGWPDCMVGIVIKEQIVYNDNSSVKIIGDPIWSLDALPEE